MVLCVHYIAVYITHYCQCGVLTFDTDEIVAAWHHTHSLADFGLED